MEDNEKSPILGTYAESYIFMANKADINSLLSCNQMSVHREKVRKRRQVLERVIDIVKMIGKHGLIYRGNKSEAAFTLADISLDHGNFLEFILLL